ncbi:MAG: hypothetical protein HYX24_05355 [Candidatus Aenigmarchaeota archaeon]|nr:hypothetical protein [Candidatus Aenigmarchaeota archaeon]
MRIYQASIVFLGLIIFISPLVSAVPPFTTKFDKASYRPGDDGVLTVTVNNNEGNDERNYEFCLSTSSSYFQTSCGLIDYLRSGERGNTEISFSISNDAPSPNSYSGIVTMTYEYKVLLWLKDKGTQTVYIPISGISYKDEANQKLSQLPSLISSAENTIRDAQGAISTAESAIKSAGAVNANVNNANNYLSSATSSLSNAQQYLSSSQNSQSSAQANFNVNAYKKALNLISDATISSENAKSYANSAYSSALQAKSAADDAKVEAERPNVGGAAPYVPPTSYGGGDNSALWLIIFIIAIGGVIWYLKFKRKAAVTKETKETKIAHKKK